MSTDSQVIRAVQHALFDEDFNLSVDEMAFAHAYLSNGGNGSAAMAEVFPHLPPASAKVKSSRWLGTPRKGPVNPELVRYIEWRKAKIAFRAKLTEDELVEKARRVYLHGVGDMAVRKTRFLHAKKEDEAAGEDDGESNVVETPVFEPNLSAANAAIELLRKIGGFGVERTSIEHSGSLDVSALEKMTDEELAEKARELATRAGVLSG